MTRPAPGRVGSALLAAALLSGCAGAAGAASTGAPGATNGSAAAGPASVGAASAGPASVGAPRLSSAGSPGSRPRDSGFAPAPTQAPVWGSPGPSPSGPGAATGPAAGAARDVSAATPFTPRSLTLPSGRLVAVHPAGVAPDGVLVVPADPGQVGWWTGGARPGDPFGGVVLAGHIDSRSYGLGALAELAHARPGQAVVVGAGKSAVRYRIASVHAVPKATLTAGTDAFRQDLPGRLVLITCAGAYDPVRHSYADNLVVVATPTG